MREVGVVVDKDGAPIFWHVPPGRTSVTLPDSRSLWGVLWENRETIAGFAHTHPGSGVPGPSWEDITTFSALERGLGVRFDWWIATTDGFGVVRWEGPDLHDYRTSPCDEEPSWLPRLRELSEEVQRNDDP